MTDPQQQDEPSNRDEALNEEPVPQAARPIGAGPGTAWHAVSGTGDAEYGEPVAERNDAARAFATSADTPLESDLTQGVPPTEPGTAEPGTTGLPAGDPAAQFPAEERGVPDAEPDEDLAEGPPDGR